MLSDARDTVYAYKAKRTPLVSFLNSISLDLAVADSQPLDGASAHDPEFQMFIDKQFSL